MRRPSSVRAWRALPPSLCAVALLALAASAAAQTDVTTGRVSGYTRGADGSALPGVNITATNSETGMTKVAVTDKNGFYYVVNLPTGTYKLEAALSGFTSVTREIRLILGSTPWTSRWRWRARKSRSR